MGGRAVAVIAGAMARPLIFRWGLLWGRAAGNARETPP